MATPALPGDMLNHLPAISAGESHFASLGTTKVHYRVVGKGETTLVFIHGWACHLNFWHEQVAAFADRARLIFIDLPGHGRSDKPNTAYTLDFLARGVFAVLRSAGVEKAVLVGHSLGAAVMCRVLAQALDKVTALVSVDGLLCRPPGTSEQMKLFVGQFCVPEWQNHARNFFSTFFPVPGTEKLRAAVVAEMLAAPQYVVAGEAEAFADPGQPEWALSKVEVPLLVLNAPSPWWTNQFEQYVRSLTAELDYRVFAGTGHFLMLEKPAEFNASLAEMLQKFNLLPA
jgi:pimeloyl-ACP methyl ester carboxylesterase